MLVERSLDRHVDDDSNDPVQIERAFKSATAELAAGLGISHTSAVNQLNYGYALGTDRLPTREALEVGLLTTRHAFALITSLVGVHPEVADVIEMKVLAEAAQRAKQGLTPLAPARISARAKELWIALDPAGADERYAAAVADREVVVYEKEAGIGVFYATMSVEKVHDLHDRLTQIAKTASKDDARTLDQRRVDALLELAGIAPHDDAPLLLTDPLNLPPLSKRETGMVMTWETAMGLADAVSTFDDRPIPPALARTLVTETKWRRWIVEPVAGELLDVGSHTYEPSEALARFVRASIPRCRFPGCGRRAANCDLDHAVEFDHDDPASGGLTTRRNLGPGCRTHHRLKTFAGWRIEITDHRGGCVWISPTGARYLVPPHDHGGPLRE
jgi:hypothetical protein